MRTIILKKSELAQLKGLGKTTEEMATRYGVTTKEMLNTLISFGLSKARPKVKEVAYVIETLNDIDPVETDSVNSSYTNTLVEA